MATLATIIAQGLGAQSTSAETESAQTKPREFVAAMATSRFAALWSASPLRFRSAWDSAYAADRGALMAVRAELTADAMEREFMRLRFRYAWGRTAWPFFHWRETDAPTVDHDPDVERLVGDLALDDSRWRTLPEHAQLVAALVHERGRRLLASDSALQRGDVRWLRAEFAAARELFAHRDLLRHVTTRLLLTHLDDNDARGIDSVRAQWLSLGPDSITRHRVDSMIAASTALRAGHVIEAYRHVDGVALEIHVLRPIAGDTTGPRPAMLWFHGGSGTTGSWSHSPGVVRALRSNGVVVIAVEVRTGTRFDAGPVEQYADAITAFNHVRSSAGRLGLDAHRIGVAGFSSGAGLALTLGTRGTDAARPAPPPAARAYPAAVIVTGACVAPASPREDGYFRKMVQRVGQPGDYSPIDLVAAAQPPMLLVHATRDEYCAFEDAQQFVARSLTAGNDVALSAVEGATHFFGFSVRPGLEQMRRAIAESLVRWGWVNR